MADLTLGAMRPTGSASVLSNAAEKLGVPVPPMDEAKVERVARAIAPKAWATYGCIGTDTLANQARRTASLRHARAAIAAIEA